MPLPSGHLIVKDHYHTLQIPPHATQHEIKQAYRRLAMIYHPDKTKNDPYAQARFIEIREAYEVLINPVRKETYLQERWYDESIGKKRTSGDITPVSVLKLCLELEKYVSTLDVHRMNRDRLFSYINQLLSSDTIERLKRFNETSVNRQIISTTLMTIKPLPLKFASALATKLEVLADNDESSLDHIQDLLRQQKKKLLWNKYQVLVIVIVTSLICLLIYVTSK